jgi:hypothetical protein
MQSSNRCKGAAHTLVDPSRPRGVPEYSVERGAFPTGSPGRRGSTAPQGRDLGRRQRSRREPRPFRAGRDSRSRRGRALLLDRGPEYIEGCSTDRSDEVGRRPKVASPQELPDQAGVIPSQHPSRDALERVDQPGELDGRRVLDQQVYVVVFAVELHQGDSEVGAHFGHGCLGGGQECGVEHPSAIFGGKDQMGMKQRDDAPAPIELGWKLGWWHTDHLYPVARHTRDPSWRYEQNRRSGEVGGRP